MMVLPPQVAWRAWRAAAWRALPFALAVLGVAAFDLGWHEFWRDEMGAMLEARNVPRSAMFEVLRVEGVPPLFHVLLKAAGVVLPNPLALVAVGALDWAILLAGTYRLLVAVSGARRASAQVALAFAFTYVYAYELGVMVRQYTLGLGLSLLSFAYLREALRTSDRRDVRAGALTAGLATLTSVHSAALAGAGLLGFGLISIARRRALRAWWPILGTLPCFALVVYLASPFPGRSEGNATLHFSPELTLGLSLQALVEGVMPSDWWFVDGFVPRRFAGATAALRSLAFWALIAGALVASAARAGALRARWRVGVFDVLAVLASWPPLLVIMVQHHWGFYRHHLFLGMPLLVFLAGWGLDPRIDGPISGQARRSGLALLAPWFLFQAVIAAGSFALDRRYPFSDTKSAASLLAEGAHVVADAEWRSGGLLFWRPDIQMRSASWRGRRFLYPVPDLERNRSAPLPPIVVEECHEAPDRIYFAGIGSSLGALAKCARRLDNPKSPFETQPFTWEVFDLFRMDCACVAAPAPR
jgi:hypothetical protein